MVFVNHHVMYVRCTLLKRSHKILVRFLSLAAMPVSMHRHCYTGRRTGSWCRRSLQTHHLERKYVKNWPIQDINEMKQSWKHSGTIMCSILSPRQSKSDDGGSLLFPPQLKQLELVRRRKLSYVKDTDTIISSLCSIEDETTTEKALRYQEGAIDTHSALARSSKL